MTGHMQSHKKFRKNFVIHVKIHGAIIMAGVKIHGVVIMAGIGKTCALRRKKIKMKRIGKARKGIKEKKDFERRGGKRG